MEIKTRKGFNLDSLVIEPVEMPAVNPVEKQSTNLITPDGVEIVSISSGNEFVTFLFFARTNFVFSHSDSVS